MHSQEDTSQLNCVGISVVSWKRWTAVFLFVHYCITSNLPLSACSITRGRPPPCGARHTFLSQLLAVSFLLAIPVPTVSSQQLLIVAGGLGRTQCHIAYALPPEHLPHPHSSSAAVQIFHPTEKIGLVACGLHPRLHRSWQAAQQSRAHTAATRAPEKEGRLPIRHATLPLRRYFLEPSSAMQLYHAPLSKDEHGHECLAPSLPDRRPRICCRCAGAADAAHAENLPLPCTECTKASLKRYVPYSMSVMQTIALTTSR